MAFFYRQPRTNLFREPKINHTGCWITSHNCLKENVTKWCIRDSETIYCQQMESDETTAICEIFIHLPTRNSDTHTSVHLASACHPSHAAVVIFKCDFYCWKFLATKCICLIFNYSLTRHSGYYRAPTTIANVFTATRTKFAESRASSACETTTNDCAAILNNSQTMFHKIRAK